MYAATVVTTMMWGVSGLAKVFESVDWIVPPYIQLGVLGKLATRIDAAAPPDKHKVLEEALGDIYNAEDTAVMLLERYEKTPHVADFKVAIGEAIEAAQLGLFHSAVSTLIPVIEGVIRKLASARGQSVGNGTQKLVDEIDELIKHQERSGGAAIERITMLEAFRDFLKKKLLEQTSRYAGTGELNRHGILHGVFSAFGYDWNFYKVLSFLDLLCFFIALTTTGISALAPDRTPESERLAQYYHQLVRLRATAVAVGARPSSH